MTIESRRSEGVGKVTVYIAAPLFNEMEIARNLEVKAMLQRNGYRVYLPQDDAGISYDSLDRGENKTNVRASIFEKDARAVAECDVFLCLLDGRAPDEGTCVELGMAYAHGKLCIGYKTDRRAMDERGDNNIMIDGCLSGRIARSREELTAVLKSLVGPR